MGAPRLCGGAEVTAAPEISVPYYCPYCGGEDLRPNPADPTELAAAPDIPKVSNAWECRECTRVFSVTFIGLVVRR